MFDPTYPLFPIIAFVGSVLVLVPLPWHLQAQNSGTCFYVLWSFLATLNQFINSIVWANDTVNRAPVWCDISIRIMLAASVGTPAASLCINRRLYQIATVQAVGMSKAEKRRAAFIDTLICVLLPLVYLVLQYIVQGHRFDVIEQIGCYPAIYNTLPAYFLSFIWPPVIGCISAVYGVFTLRAFLRRRAASSQFIAPSGSSKNPGLTGGHYLRLMALATTDIILTTPLGFFFIYLNRSAEPFAPWISWADTHFNFSRVGQIPAFAWRAQRLTALGFQFTRWMAPVSALMFFAFFGCAADARRNYDVAFNVLVATFWRIAACIGIRRPTDAVPLSPSSKGNLHATPTKPVSNSRSALSSISLPFSTVGTGSLTATGSPSPSSSNFTDSDLKRASL
ncbi:pheromone A receptor-domain-containing protein [Mycena pura]|uniref:Pheromone A receptor-domain-containing protein n=1 Tax=Mycena pura TaxID=153505 RepID=A0AAD6YMF6_9AGAR|nr:pheromone A receptor-domain-containing protein [Mycena pura]